MAIVFSSACGHWLFELAHSWEVGRLIETNGKTVDRVGFVLWSFFAYVAFGLAAWFFLHFLLFAEYVAPTEYGRGLKVWHVLWDMRGLVLLPGIFVLFGLLFRRNAFKSKRDMKHHHENKATEVNKT